MNIHDASFGVDVGGVLIDRVHDRSDTSMFSDRYLETPEIEGAFETLGRLVGSQFGGRVWVVSKCGARMEAKPREWLDHHRFWDRTGVERTHIRFCRARADKAAICEELAITHFVDDRLEVLGYLDRVPHLYLFRPDRREMNRFRRFLPRVQRVDSWADLGRLLQPERPTAD